MICFEDCYKNKKVLVTGNTGFKGSWVSIWLLNLGAEVYGYSKDIPTSPSNFEICKLSEKYDHEFGDIRDFNRVKSLIERVKPDFVFHLAAQPIVKESYNDPLKTIETNVLGTTNILEALRQINNPCNAIIITSDKCYDNIEWTWGYRENDRLGGEDPYSASKGAAELVIKTYARSFFSQNKSNVKIISTRAGNVVGGGDWAAYRIIPDVIRAWSSNVKLEIRNPKSTRPWQHVLEPLSGYLLAGKVLSENKNLNGEPFNFGPNAVQDHSVEELLYEMKKYLTEIKWEINQDTTGTKEAALLKLNCDKALSQLGWYPNLNFADSIKLVSDWYLQFYKNAKTDMFEFTNNQILYFVQKAVMNKQCWVK